MKLTLRQNSTHSMQIGAVWILTVTDFIKVVAPVCSLPVGCCGKISIRLLFRVCGPASALWSMRGRVCNAVGSLSCALISSRQRTSAFSPSRQWPLILLICMVNEHWPVTAGSHKSASAAPYVACLSAQRLACSAALSVTYSIRRSSRRVRALPRTGAAPWLFVSRELRRRGQFSSLVVVLLVTSRDKQNEVPMMVNTICTSRLRS